MTREPQADGSSDVRSGLLLLAAAIVAMLWANSPWQAAYHALWHHELVLPIGPFALRATLHQGINDALMAVFFFVVGLELKREFLGGQLARPAQAILPLAAAVGGMLLPASIFLAFNGVGPASDGWGIPMATDIAFAVGVMALLGERVPPALKVFLTTLAIADDLGAVLVIALFYTAELSLLPLAAGLGLLGVLAAGNRAGIRSPVFYALFGIGGVWTCFLMSGVHATVAGVLVAATIPASPRTDGPALLERLEHALHPVVAFGVMPLFALANAGIALPSDFGAALFSPVALGTGLGLLLGKPLGILLVCALVVRLGWARVGVDFTWSQLAAAGVLAGIGFTMSLFINELAFDAPELRQQAKLGILLASFVAGALGYALLRRRPSPPRKREGEGEFPIGKTGEKGYGRPRR